jgi:hypothetical protein
MPMPACGSGILAATFPFGRSLLLPQSGRHRACAGPLLISYNLRIEIGLTHSQILLATDCQEAGEDTPSEGVS